MRYVKMVVHGVAEVIFRALLLVALVVMLVACPFERVAEWK